TKTFSSGWMTPSEFWRDCTSIDSSCPEACSGKTVEVGNTYTPAAIDDDVHNLYATGLFYNVRVSTEPSAKGMDLVYNVQCNPRLAEVDFTGNSRFSEAQLRKFIGSRVGDLFNERRIFSDSQAIQKAYEDAGCKDTGIKYSYDIDQPIGSAFLTR